MQHVRDSREVLRGPQRASGLAPDGAYVKGGPWQNAMEAGDGCHVTPVDNGHDTMKPIESKLFDQ